MHRLCAITINVCLVSFTLASSPNDRNESQGSQPNVPGVNVPDSRITPTTTTTSDSVATPESPNISLNPASDVVKVGQKGHQEIDLPEIYNVESQQLHEDLFDMLTGGGSFRRRRASNKRLPSSSTDLVKVIQVPDESKRWPGDGGRNLKHSKGSAEILLEVTPRQSVSDDLLSEDERMTDSSPFSLTSYESTNTSDNEQVPIRHTAVGSRASERVIVIPEPDDDAFEYRMSTHRDTGVGGNSKSLRHQVATKTILKDTTEINVEDQKDDYILDPAYPEELEKKRFAYQEEEDSTSDDEKSSSSDDDDDNDDEMLSMNIADWNQPLQKRQKRVKRVRNDESSFKRLRKSDKNIPAQKSNDPLDTAREQGGDGLTRRPLMNDPLGKLGTPKPEIKKAVAAVHTILPTNQTIPQDPQDGIDIADKEGQRTTDELFGLLTGGRYRKKRGLIPPPTVPTEIPGGMVMYPEECTRRPVRTTRAINPFAGVKHSETEEVAANVMLEESLIDGSANDHSTGMKSPLFESTEMTTTADTTSGKMDDDDGSEEVDTAEMVVINPDERPHKRKSHGDEEQH